ncbi:GtrA family protein [Rossellomorea sp. NS-SX7]|uniref:GtrA family protein n=1 Tax=Rossellomorea sp. NS-SX7 TaxID=3463856 RepID=UPI00405999C9
MKPRKDRFILLMNTIIRKLLIQKKMKNIKEAIAYLVMGVLTTVINIAVFFVCNDIVVKNYIVATSIAWLISVLFAYFTNKIFVFHSRSFELNVIYHEILRFIGFRITSYIIDVLLMIVLIEFFILEENISKIVSNGFVVIMNYFASKYLVFNKKD